MPARYQVRLLDTTGTQIAVFTDADSLLSLVYSRKLNFDAPYMVEIDGKDSRTSLFALDSLVEIRRRVTDIDGNLLKDWYTEFSGLHRTPVTLIFNDGRQSFRSHGFDYNEFLNRREIWYPAGSVGSGKSGPAETVMKDFADENIGPSALASNGRDEDAVMTGLTIEADGATGATWTGRRARRNLLAVLREVALFGSINFRVVRTSGVSWEFQTFVGVDRSTIGLVSATGLNGAGNVPVIFSVDQGTMQNVAHSINRSAEANAALALGRGEGESRETLVKKNATAIADSPWNRREKSRSGDEFQSSNLDTLAQLILDENAKNEKFSFKVVPAINRMYGVDYFLGDKLTNKFEDQNVTAHLQLVGVQATFGEGVEVLDHEFAEVII